ncbi:MAG: tetratricopeptide repeat protein [Akkermansia sp.]
MKRNQLSFFTLCLSLSVGLVLTSCQQGWNKMVEAAYEGVPSQQYRLGYKLLARGEKGDANRQAALQWFMLGARKGYAPSQVAVAACYQFGLAGKTDLHQAEHWYEKAAKQDNVNAYRGLLSLALTRDDMTSAAPWLEKLALRGDIASQMLYANMLAEGQGVEPDPRKSVDFWRYAAISGDKDALLMMGMCYSQGWGVPQNNRLAIAWWKLADEAGSGAARQLLRGE